MPYHCKEDTKRTYQRTGTSYHKSKVSREKAGAGKRKNVCMNMCSPSFTLSWHADATRNVVDVI